MVSAAKRRRPTSRVFVKTVNRFAHKKAIVAAIDHLIKLF